MSLIQSLKQFSFLFIWLFFPPLFGSFRNFWSQGSKFHTDLDLFMLVLGHLKRLALLKFMSFSFKEFSWIIFLISILISIFSILSGTSVQIISLLDLNSNLLFFFFLDWSSFTSLCSSLFLSFLLSYVPFPVFVLCMLFRTSCFIVLVSYVHEAINTSSF